MRRRSFQRGLAACALAGSFGGAVVAGARGGTATAAGASFPAEPVPGAGAFGAIERAVGGRLGVFALDLNRGRGVGHRAGERFPMCSTFKWLLAAAVLARVDAGAERLERRVVYGRDALLDHAPVTAPRVGPPGMTVAELCAAAVGLSDNPAANLLLDAVGGPAAVTAFARALGDDVTRLDRREPELNDVPPGDPRDTTSPAAMAGALRGALFDGGLSPRSAGRLADWLIASPTGAKRLRAGWPADWRVGDKTGTGPRGTTNDVAVAWPPGRGPLLVAAYLTDCAAPLDEREAALAVAGRLAREALTGG